MLKINHCGNIDQGSTQLFGKVSAAHRLSRFHCSEPPCPPQPRIQGNAQLSELYNQPNALDYLKAVLAFIGDDIDP